MITGELPNINADAKNHPLTREKPATHAADIGAYVGVPLTLANGRVYGALCVSSHAAQHRLGDPDLALMRFLSELVAAELAKQEQRTTARSMQRDRLSSFLEPGGITILAQPIVGLGQALELTEHVEFTCLAPLQEALTRMRSHGLRVAVDDTGSGHASLQNILALAPEVIKLDLGLVKGIDRDPVRRALARALSGFATECGAARPPSPKPAVPSDPLWWVRSHRKFAWDRSVPGQTSSSGYLCGPVLQGDRPRPELMAIDELELDALAQTGEQRRPVSGENRLHKEHVLVDQSQICQRQRERHTPTDRPSPGSCLSR